MDRSALARTDDRRVSRPEVFDNLVGKAPAFDDVLSRLPALAWADATVLITGETGTGKELVSRAVHYLDRARARPVRRGQLRVARRHAPRTRAVRPRARRVHGRPRAAAGSHRPRRGWHDVPGTRWRLSPRARRSCCCACCRTGRFARWGRRPSSGSTCGSSRRRPRGWTTWSRSGALRADLYYRLCVFAITLPPLRERREDILPLCALVIVIGGLLIAAADGRTRWWWPFERPRPAVTLGPSAWSPRSSVPFPSSSGADAPSGWTAVAKATMPAVVNIATSRTIRGGERGPSAPFFSDPFFRFFTPPGQEPRREQSLGSGAIVTPDGYVLTNNHVVEGASDIRVTLADRREFKAKLVGADAKTDLAVLKLSGSQFPVLALGDSSRVEVAEVVLAIGNPFGLNQTVTMGIVSAVGRENVGISDYEDFIQTDAAINPGNSGGALVNARGELIGTNTAIFSQSGGYMGIGFAVPVNMARQVMDQIVRRGRVTRGYLGVSVQEVTPAMARGLGLATPRGILIGDVAPDGPAARAGLKRGAVIAAADGTPVDDPGHFRKSGGGARRRTSGCD